MGEDPKAIMAATNAAEEKRQKEEEVRKAEAARRKAAISAASSVGQSGTGGAANERGITSERADRWAAEMIPTTLAAEGGRRQGAPLNATGKADTSPGGFLHVPGAKRNFSARRKKDESGGDESEGSYIEIPDSKFLMPNLSNKKFKNHYILYAVMITSSILS